MTFAPHRRVALLGLVAALFMHPAPADALPLYFTVPDADREPFPGQPTLLYTLGPDDRPRLIGPITLDGVAEAVSAIALSPQGELIGFIEGQGTLVVTIDPITAIADPGPVPVVLPTLVAGAAFAPDGRLWVLDLFDQLARPLDDGALGPPSFAFPDELGGADLIFDGDGRCYFTGVTFAGAPAGLHRCDVNAGTLEPIGDWQDQGFDAIALPSGLAVGPSADPCTATLYAIDGGGEEEIGRSDFAEPLALRAIAELGDDFAAPGFPDAAGFFVRPDTADCALPVEDCASGVDDDGDDAIDCADEDCREDPACEGIAARPPRPGDLVITEILYDPIAVDDTTGEFIELHNPGRGRIELRGLRIGDNTGDDAVIINRSLIVPPGGYVIAARSADPARNGGLIADIVLGDALALGNTTDRVRLTYGSPRVIIAELSYDEGAGWPSAAGASLQYGAEYDPLAADRAAPGALVPRNRSLRRGRPRHARRAQYPLPARRAAPRPGGLLPPARAPRHRRAHRRSRHRLWPPAASRRHRSHRPQRPRPRGAARSWATSSKASTPPNPAPGPGSTPRPTPPMPAASPCSTNTARP
jgi:hypothetical protein